MTRCGSLIVKRKGAKSRVVVVEELGRCCLRDMSSVIGLSVY